MIWLIFSLISLLKKLFSINFLINVKYASRSFSSITISLDVQFI